ncbi:MAG: CoA transferase, partial [Chloroflexi bacterium]
EVVAAFSLNHREPSRRGNRHSSMAPHGCYSCSGDDEWVTIACENDAEFAFLCSALEQPGLADDPRFADIVSRYRNQNELDEIISAWTNGRTKEEAADVLQAG